MRIAIGLAIGLMTHSAFKAFTTLFSLRGTTRGAPEIGSLSSATNTTGYVTVDHLGRTIQGLANEIMERGGRRARQLLSATNAPATQTLTSLAAGTYVYRHYGIGSVAISGATDGSYGSLVTTVSTDDKCLAFTVTVAQNVTFTVTTAPTKFSCTSTTGDTDPLIPDEYVSKDFGIGAELVGDVEAPVLISGSNLTDNGDGTFTISEGSTVRFKYPVNLLSNLVDSSPYIAQINVIANTANTAMLDWCDQTARTFTGLTGIISATGARTYDSSYRFVDVSCGSSGAITFSLSSLKSLDHGSNVNGVRYFNYDKSHITVASNVVTESTNYTYLTTMKGIQGGPAFTNLLPYSWQSDLAYPNTVSCTWSGNTLTVIAATGSVWYTAYVVEPSTVYTYAFKLTTGTYSGVPKLAVYDNTHSSFISVDVAYDLVNGVVSHTFTTPAGCVSINCRPYRNGTGTGTLTITESILVAGSIAYPSPKTTAAAVTINAMAPIYVTPDGGALGNNLFIKFKFTALGLSTTTRTHYFNLSDSGNTRFSIRATESGVGLNKVVVAYGYGGAAVQNLTASNASTIGTEYCCCAWLNEDSGAALFINGIEQEFSSNLPAIIQNATTFNLMSNGTEQTYATVKDLTIQKIKISRAEALTRSQP